MINTPREVTLKGQGDKGRLHKVVDCRQDRNNTRTQSQKDNKKHLYNHSFSCLALVPVVAPALDPIFTATRLDVYRLSVSKTMIECGPQHFFDTCMHHKGSQHAL